MGVGLITDSFVYLWNPFSPTGLSHSALIDGMCVVLFSNVLVCVWLKSLGGLFFSSGEKESGRIGGRGGRESMVEM